MQNLLQKTAHDGLSLQTLFVTSRETFSSLSLGKSQSSSFFSENYAHDWISLKYKSVSRLILAIEPGLKFFQPGFVATVAWWSSFPTTRVV